MMLAKREAGFLVVERAAYRLKADRLLPKRSETIRPLSCR